MEKSLDEKIYLVTTLSTDDFKPDNIEAYGVKMFEKKITLCQYLNLLKQITIC